MTRTDRATEAASHWGAQILRLISHRENAVYEARLPDGTRAALRLHRQGYQSDAAIASELWWCAALADAGVPVPRALPSRNGKPLVPLQGGGRASVVTWADGAALGAADKPFDLPKARIVDLHHALGRLLARLHDATDALTLPADFVRPAWDIAGLVGEAPFWGRFWDHPAASPDQRTTLIAARGFLHEWLTAHLAAGAALGPIHADVLRENVLVGAAGLSLIDFDDSGIGFRLYDLGTALIQNLSEPEYPALRDALIAGYAASRPASIEAVEVMALARWCASVGWTMSRLSPGDPIHRSHLAKAVNWARQVIG